MKLRQASLISIVVFSSITDESIIPCATAEIVSFPLIPHHVQRARRLKELGIDDMNIDEFDRDYSNNNHHLRRRTTEGAQMNSLYYGKGTHYVDLWCGTPYPQRQTVIVDTGSAVTAFPCSGCDHCGAGKYHINNAYEESNSTTFSVGSCDDCDKGQCSEDGRCILTTYYAEESSWSAFKASDRCYLGGPHNRPLMEESGTDTIDPDHAKALTIDLDFGCQTNVGGMFKRQLADGIMGMEDDSRSFWSQLYASGKGGSSKQFSLCFSQPLQHNRTGTGAGAITLGGSDTRLHLTPMVFATRKNRNGYYKVQIRKMYLRHGQGGESARSMDPNAKVVALDIQEESLNSGGVIVDSGTTDTYFHKVISPQFRSAFKELTGREFNNNKWRMTEVELASLPTILLQLEGERGINKHLNPDPSQVVGLAGDMDLDHPHDVLLAIPPSHYMDYRENGQYTPRIYDTEASGTVLGANAITGHDVLFDMDRQVIGWAASHCDYHTLVTGNGFKDVLDGPLYREQESYDSDSDEDDDSSDSDEESISDDDEDSDSGDDDESSEVNDTDTNVESKPSDSGVPFESALPVSGLNMTGYENENTTNAKETNAGDWESMSISDQGLSPSNTNNTRQHEFPPANNMDLDHAASNTLDQATNPILHAEGIDENTSEIDALASSFSRGWVLVGLGILVIFARCCTGRLFCLTRSLSPRYKKVEDVDDGPMDEEQRVCIELRRRTQLGNSG